MTAPYPEAAVAYLHPGELSWSFHTSLDKLNWHEFARTGMRPFELAQWCGTDGIVEGRNITTASFLDDTRCHWLLWVDSDMGFAPDTLERLTRVAHTSDRPIVGGLCFGLRRGEMDSSTHAQTFRTFPTLYAWREFGDRVGFEVWVDYPRDRLTSVSATGAACILMHRSALLKMRERDGDNWFTKVTHPVGPTTFSEDMSFCIRAAACDIPLFVDTSVKTSHHKGGIFLDETAWDRQQTLDAPLAEAVA